MDVHTVQAVLVDVIKRRAIRTLHETRRGEAALLRGYLWGERGAESAVVGEILDAGAPEWLADDLRRHLADEHRHADVLAARLAEMGSPDVPDAPAGPLVRRKKRQLEEIVASFADRFRAGRLVPLLAIAARFEATAVRVLERHLSVLSSQGGRTERTADVLHSIVRDERRHVAHCERALHRLVDPQEGPELAELQARIAHVDRSLGIAGAVGLLALGQVYRFAEPS